MTTVTTILRDLADDFVTCVLTFGAGYVMALGVDVLLACYSL